MNKFIFSITLLISLTSHAELSTPIFGTLSTTTTPGINAKYSLKLTGNAAKELYSNIEFSLVKDVEIDARQNYRVLQSSSYGITCTKTVHTYVNREGNRIDGETFDCEILIKTDGSVTAGPVG